MKTSHIILLSIGASVLVAAAWYFLIRKPKIPGNTPFSYVPSTTNRPAQTAQTPRGYSQQVGNALAAAAIPAAAQALQSGANAAADWVGNLFS